MCSKLTETAADDLIRFVRRVRREAAAREQSGDAYGPTMAALDELAQYGTHLLDKHGLLTMADDPEVARVFRKPGFSATGSTTT